MPQRRKPRVTSSATRSRRSTKKPITNSARRSNRQKVSKAKVTTGSDLRVKTLTHQKAPKKLTRSGDGAVGRRGRYGERAKVTTGRGRSGPKLPKLPAKSSKVTRGGSKPRPTMPKESAARKAKRLANRAAKGYGGKAVKGAALKAAGRVAAPLAVGLAVGKLMQRLRKNVSTSGRGAGRAAFNPKKKKR